MSLINALLKSGHAEHSLEFRLHLRYELLMLGIQEIIDRLRNTHGSALEDHFDLFEMMRQEDEQEFASNADSGSSSPIDFESPAGMAEALTRKLDSSVALPHLISLLQHLLMIPGDERHRHLWRLFDIILQQISLKSTMGTLASESDPQYSTAALQFDMDELLSRLRTQHECEKLEKALAETNAELENERKRVMELENRLSDLQDGASLSSFSRISDLSNPSDPCHSPTPTIYSSSASSLPPVNPPAPPPPPPTALQLRALGGPLPNAVQEPKKKIPKPPTTLKTLNWTKISAQKIPGTVWEKIEDEKFYKQIDLQALATAFVAGNGHSDESDYSTSTLQRRLRTESAISVIEPRRAQNCTIMLSKLKLSHREIRAAVLSMDDKGRLPKDMIEQMLKFVPTKEEFSILRETANKHKTPSVLALADRFLLEVGQIPRYEQRLKCLHIIRTFQERVDEITPYLNAVIKASNTSSSNKKLRQLLALILAIGNYLNHGKRSGNAMGFTIGSLGVIHDVKSSVRHDRNLLHFIIELLESKFPEIIHLKRELVSVYEAARYNRAEMSAELRSLEGTLRVLSTELQVQQKLASTSTTSPTTTGNIAPPEPQPNPMQSPKTQKEDKFIEVVSTFLENAKKQYNELERLNNEMNKAFSTCTTYFAEDAQTCSPDVFFGVFSKFFNQFTESHHHMWEEREELERVKRQTLARSIFAKKSGNRRTATESGKDFERLINALQTGEFFSEDLTRLRTSFRVPKKEKTKS
uniref:FH2 domain-containing protein n=1 Tax=Acrobeloides nanus TaxID=290746 RepID=A0A914BU84_9BILA